ncbi:hypothetical protein ACIPUF_04025 [Pectobacterium sp. CHL-2024]
MTYYAGDPLAGSPVRSLRCSLEGETDTGTSSGAHATREDVTKEGVI